MNKPTKPTNLMPRSFGGVKNNFSTNLQNTGFEDGVPTIYGGDNLNYQLDATGKELDYCEKICDFVNELPIGKVITTSSNNKLVYETLSTVGKTNNYNDLSNLPTIPSTDNLADKDLDNLSSTGEKHFVNKTQITSTALDIKNRIIAEFTDADGITIKQGSVVIVPYGVENLGLSVGDTFINSNFKVYDTQFYSGKYFVWAELQGDLNYKYDGESTAGYEGFIDINLSSNTCFLNRNADGYTGSGNLADASFSHAGCYYASDVNRVYRYSSTGEQMSTIMSLPILNTIYSANYTSGLSHIKQVFNGAGAMGSHFWVDKGVKVLVPNGRNDDNTLKNTEYTTSRLLINQVSNEGEKTYEIWYGNNATLYQPRFYSEVQTIGDIDYSTLTGGYRIAYVEDDNKYYYRSGASRDLTQVTKTPIASLEWSGTSATSIISDVRVYAPFRAVNRKDVPTKTSDLTNDSGFITSASVPTKTSDLTNDSGFITSSALPTVNNATLTIQKNGTTVNTFTANASSNVTANITVPTKTSDLTNNSGFITSSSLPTKVSDLTNDSGFIANNITTDFYITKDAPAIRLRTSASTYGGIRLENSSFDISSQTAPASGDTGIFTLHARDTNDQIISRISSVHTTLNNMYTIMEQRRIVNNGLLNCSIRVGIAQDGRRYIQVDGDTFSFPMCTTAPTTTTSTAASNNVACVIENYSSTNYYSGYRVYSDKCCEQWGTTPNTLLNDQVRTTELFKTYRKRTENEIARYNIMIAPYGISNAGSNQFEMYTEVVDGNHFKARIFGGDTNASYIYWRTCGYLE